MRKILFRGKRTDTGKWENGFPIIIGNKAFICNADINTALPINKLYKFCIEIEKHTLSQYTGITDSCGKLIFEKDIVSYPDCEISTESGSGDCFENIGVVEWDSESMSFYFTDRVKVDMNDIDIKTEVDVIGNVFDYPNLLDDLK